MKKPTSYAAKKTQELLDEPMKVFDGLDQAVVFALHFYMTDALGFKNYKMHIVCNTDPKQVVFEPLTSDGKRLNIKMKKLESFDNLPIILGIPNYVIRFIERNEIIKSDG